MEENPIYKPSDKKSIKKPLLVIIGIVALAIVILILITQLWNKGTDNTVGTQDQINLIDQYKNQLAELEKNVNSDPSNAQFRRNYAVALYATGDLNKALEQYLEEKKLNPDDPIVYNNLGNIYRDQGKNDDAVTSYKKAIELDKQMTNAYINLANLYIYNIDKVDLGINIYKDALTANPDSVEINLLLANAYEQSGQSVKAKETFSSILKKDPNNQPAKLGLERLK